MALITRISRLFRADFHAVLDQIEEPELLLRQAVREMEDDVVTREQRVRAAVHEQGELRARRRELEQSLGELDGELELCFAAQKDDLAKNLVRRKLEAQRLAKHLAARETGIDGFLEEQRRLLDEHRMTLEGLKQKAEIFARRARDPVPGAGPADPFARDLVVTDDEVEVAFLREQARRASS